MRAVRRLADTVFTRSRSLEQQTAQDEFAREKSSLQIALQEQVIERQRRTSKVEAPELRAVTRQMRTMRGQTAAAPKAAGKRDAKGALSGATPPLRQGEVEEDFEEMQQHAQRLAPHLDIDLDIDVQPHKRLRPVEAVRPTARMEASASQGRSGRGRRADFDFKGKSRLEVANARITVWYEEEHYGRKTDVPYVGVVKFGDPREGLYVQFENYDGEMLITNEDDWRWVRRAPRPPVGPACAGPPPPRRVRTTPDHSRPPEKRFACAERAIGAGRKGCRRCENSDHDGGRGAHMHSRWAQDFTGTRPRRSGSRGRGGRRRRGR